MVGGSPFLFMDIKLDLFQLQRDISNDPHRFRVLACGRRWGKTFFAMCEALKLLCEGFEKTKRKQRGWIVAPTFPLVREDWLTAETLFSGLNIVKKQTEMKMSFWDRGFLEFKSAERDDEGLRGAGLDFVVVDEASRVSKKSWEYGIRPALADKLGRAIFISTPKGRNWFYDIYLAGKDSNETKSWQYPTYTNPYFPMSEWETIKNTTPEMILKQEYMADFLEDDASVFKNIFRCLKGVLEEPQDEYYTIGVDLGKSVDFTVITVIKNSTAGVVDIYRMKEIDWSLQKAQILAISRKYKKNVVYIDSTGLGDPIEEDLRKSGVNTKDYKFTNASKQELVEQLIVAIEQGLIGIPDCPQTQFLIDELKAFSYDILPSGRIQYSAPEGLHDDGVISLGLAVRGIWSLLYKDTKPKEEKKPWGTANDWDRLYDEIDMTHSLNPFMTREQSVEMVKRNNLRRMLRRL